MTVRRNIAFGMAAFVLLVCLLQPVGAAILSSKRGFADTGASYSNLQATGAGWYYTWGLGAANPGSFSAKFAPMFWGGWAVNQSNINAVKNNSNVEWVLGFNEPERTDQANMTVADAITAWTTLSNGFAGSGKKLVTPAVSDTTAGKAWMTDFHTQAVAAGVQVDAVAFHWYGWSSPSNPSQAASNFMGSMNWYHNLWNKPVFVTEFAIHDWGGAYTDAEISEANRQFLDIVVPWMESTSWVQGYAWYHWFGDAHLYEGSPMTPTPMGYEYVGAIRTGELEDIGGVNLGEHVAYLAGGELTMTGTAGTVRYINALDGTNTISGSVDYSTSSTGWARIQPGATLRKTGTNKVTFGGSVTNSGTLRVEQGTLELIAPVTGGGNIVVQGGFLDLNAGASIDQAPLIDVRTGGTLDVIGLRYSVRNGQTLNTADGASVVGAVTVATGCTVSGAGNFVGSITVQSGAFLRVGANGMPTNQPLLIDNFDSYNNSTLKNIGAHSSGDVTAGVWDGVYDGTGAATVEDDATPASPSDNVMQAYGVNTFGSSDWRGAITDLSNNFSSDFTVADNAKTTVFFQFKAISGTGNYDTMFGLTDTTANVDNNNSWQDFAVMPFLSGGTVGAADFKATTAGGDVTAISNIAGDTWYNVWLVIDTLANNYDVYTSTGTANGTLGVSDAVFRNSLGTGDLSAFGFTQREGGKVQIDNLYWINGESTVNPLGGGSAIVYSPETMTVSGNLLLYSGAKVTLDIATSGVNDLLDVNGSLTAAGTLEVLLDGSAPALGAGATFDLLDFTSATGAFTSYALPLLDLGLAWNVSDMLTTGQLSVVLDVDLDDDGLVTGQDFLLIQQTNPALIPAWDSLYGAHLVAGTGLVATATAVPEPGTLLLLLAPAVLGVSGLRYTVHRIC